MSPIFAIMGAASGNLVEWYDFYIYNYTALYFSSAFFPGGDPTSQLLKSAVVFAVAFLTRPIGGWFFGRLADKQGRRFSMVVSVILMSTGSLMICLLPGYASIGYLAPLFLLLARMLQGLSVGGEYGASATYMSEVATQGRRGFYSSFHYVTLIGGQLLAALVLLLLNSQLTQEQMYQWGWRVPFGLGALAALVALWLRRGLPETTTEAHRNKSEAGTLSALWRDNRPACLAVMGFTGSGSLIFYTYTTYMQKFLVNSVGLEVTQATRINTWALLVFMLVQPLFGALSDRFGRRPCMIAYGIWSMLTPVPILMAIYTNRDETTIFALILVALLGQSLYTSISGIVKAELFPVAVRGLGVGFCYAISNAIFGGTAESTALYLKSTGHETYYFYYVAFMGAVVLLVALWMPDNRYAGYLRGHHHEEE